MRGLPLLTLALLALAGCSGLVADLADFEPIQSAEWKPGYHFAYSTSSNMVIDGTASAGGQSMPVHETEATKPTPFLSYGLLNTEIQKDGESYALATLDNGGGVLAFRLRDLQPMQVGFTYASASTGAGAGGAATVTGEAQLLLQPPAIDHSMLRFPMKKGDGWSGKLPLPNMPEVEDLGGVELTSLVRGAESIDTPLGTFNAVRTEHVFSAPNVQAMLDAARKDAEDHGVKFTRYDVDMDARIVVHYVKELHNVARLATLVKMDLDLAAEYEGQPASFQVHGEFEMVQDLVSATFDESAQVPLAEIAKGGYGTARLPGFSGSTTKPVDQALKLTASDTSLDLPGDSTTLRATAKGLEGTPRISVFDGAGALVAAGSGSSLKFEPEAAGVYTASASLGGLESKAVALRANYEESFTETCELSSPVAPVACTAVPLKLAPGVTTLTLEVGGAAQRLGGDLVWRDGDGMEHTETVGAGLSSARFTFADPAAGPGEVSFVPRVATPGTTVQYTLTAVVEDGASVSISSSGPPASTLRLGEALVGLLAP